ncbi:hypothetical protein FEM48_Zijuj02G0198600 [Ziziphus jujuba var. spinosa]|uniref:Uncharacterized protein n=1 Tax=Ziziphus jujuba var. spinosa TaxID=714518 RepID=A0A978VXN2_ZIZJJ|nr:hypothetical protein FEM48_Zijuj02G0198600 [Ziziphus jujuba var. spinosa]
MKSFAFVEFLVVFTVFLICGFVMSKECTNVFPPLSSHTYRYALLTSNNETWKKEILSYYHLIPNDDSLWKNLIPRKKLKEEDEHDWTMMYKKMKNPDVLDDVSGDFLKEVSLHDVRLDPTSLHGRAQHTNLEYLLMLDVDRLVWSFRKTAGLSTPGTPYQGWESPTTELRGHFVGHYLSATAQMWASTHQDRLKDKMFSIVSILADCQKKIGSGYLSAFPSEEFDRFEALQQVWAPYYTIHKILAGLLDQYILAGNDQAFKIMTWMVDHFYGRVQKVITKYSIERHYLSLNEETGGMNDVLYRLYTITRNEKHLLLAHLFDKPCFLGLLAVQADDIAGFHANTHIPVVIGAQRRYEVTGDPLYREIGRYFMEIVNSSHAYATGGTSVSEFWSDPKRLATTLQTENEESCTTYNMLKVSRNLFRWTKETTYADYYERALTNGVLSIQRGTDPGVMVYMLPLNSGSSKSRSYHGWGRPFEDFWCCYGTGIESFSKLGDSIYFEEEGSTPGLYIIQYISSSLNWKSGQIGLSQKVDPVNSWDPYLRVNLTISSVGGTGKSSTLNLRMPIWTQSSGATAALNAKSLSVSEPGSFLSVSGNWKPGDTLSVQLPISVRTEAIKDDRPEYASLQAILYGPFLLVAYSTGDLDIKAGSENSPSDWITPIPAGYNSYLFTFSQKHGSDSLVIANSNQSLVLEKLPEAGTDSAVHATFRLIFHDSSLSNFATTQDAIGKLVTLEPFDLPGMVVAHQGVDGNVVVAGSSFDESSSVFRVVQGLDGVSDSVSFESYSNEDCYLFSSDGDSDGSLKLKCNSEENTGSDFSQATSFGLSKGISEYHPISFVAKGATRNFLLSPLISFRDESYTVYFNI